MKKILILALACLGVASAAPLPPADKLATNTVTAKYVGVKEIPCRHLTSLCPDRCNHGTKVAQFEVISSEKYEKGGEYGDAQAKQGDILFVDIKKDIEGQDPAIAAKIGGEIKEGETVSLTITHYYVNKDGSRYPVRPCELLEKITQ